MTQPSAGVQVSEGNVISAIARPVLIFLLTVKNGMKCIPELMALLISLDDAI